MYPERKFAVSTDSSGVLGTPKVWKELWAFLDNDPRFEGFEMIAWGGKFRWWTRYLFEQAPKHQCPVIGIHGRMGGVHDIEQYHLRFLTFIVNNFVADTTTVAKTYGPHCRYILFHNPELRGQKTRKMLAQEANNINLLYVENHVGAGSVGAALEIAQELKVDNIKTGVAFDLAHFTRSYPSILDLKAQWAKALKSFDWILRETDVSGNIPVGIHIPLGTDMSDNLPLEEINKKMWRDLAVMMEGRDLQIVVENKQSGNPFFITTKARIQQVERNKKVIEALTKNQII